MTDLLGYKCPCCGGAIEFNSNVQKMKCPYCDTEFEMENLQEFADEHLEEDTDPQWDAEGVEQNGDTLDGEELFSCTCENCGGEIIADETMASSSCPYCGNPVINKKQLEGALKPDLVIPFKLDKKAAEENLRRHLKGKLLLPKCFKDENRIKEVKGIYVPFWLYDCETDAEIRCRATRLRHWETSSYSYTETQHYLVSRGGKIGFEKVPVDGSLKMDDALMQSIEPYHYSDCVDFQKAYLAGYLADRYDQDAQTCSAAANQRVRQSTVDAFMNTIHGYATCIPEHTNIQINQGKITYALLPVWVLNTKFKDKMYTFAMNGQTGKFVGNLPMDKGKAVKVAMGVFAGVFAAAFLLTGLM